MSTALDTLKALAFHTDDMEVLRPGVDYHDGFLYFTLPMDRSETKTVGKGEAAKKVSQRITSTICVRSAGPGEEHPTVFPYDEDSVRVEGFRFPQTFTQAPENRWPMHRLSEYLDGSAGTVDPYSLFDRLRNVYKTHIDYPDDVYYDIVPLYVMGSYVFPMFRATGYIHFNGTRDSGKSQNMLLQSAFGLNTVWASSMTPSSLFRTVAGCPGIICVDEAEAEHWKTEKGQELRQIILAGYANGSTVARTEKGPGDKFITIYYDAYCPKTLSSISPLDPTLASRCIVIPMQRTLRQIPEFNPESDDNVDIRGQLYQWAMQHHPDIRRVQAKWEREREQRAPGLTARAIQIATIYLVLAEHVGGPAMADRLVGFFTDYFAKAAKAREDQDLQLTLLKALPRVLASKDPHPGNFYSIKDIHEVVIEYLEDDAKDYYKTRTVSRHLVTLGLTRTQMAKGGKQVQITEDVVRTAFRRHGVTPFVEDTEWLDGTRNYQNANSTLHDGLAALDGLFS
jgi:hypothetical protein